MTDVEQIKAKIDIVSFLSEYMTLKKAGRNFKAICPFHSEKTPSFIVSPERGSWHCFGACATGGDVIGFLQKWEGIEFLEALKILAKRAGVTLSHYAPSEASQLKEKLYEINHLSSEFFHYLLVSHRMGRKALKYLSGRHIKEQTIKTFRLGYAPDSWDSLFRYLLKKGYSREDIYTAGLLVKSDRGTYYDRFRGRLVFTLCDHRGNIVGFSGRLLDEGVYPEQGREVYSEQSRGVHSERQRGAKYVNTSETPVYIKGNVLYGLEITKEAIKKEKEAVVVEGEFDFLSSYQSGVSNVVAIKGSALTEGQILLLKRYTEDVILALDSDFAGNEAARRGLETAENNNLSVRIARLLYGKDPAECIEKDPQLWVKSVKKPIPIYDFIIENAIFKYGKDEALSKKKVSDEAVPFLAKITNPIVASHYIKYLAKILSVSEEGVEMAIRQFQKRKQLFSGTVKIAAAKTSREILLEEHLLALMIQSKNPAESLSTVLSILIIDDFYQPVFKRITELLILYFKTHKKFDLPDFAALLSAEMVTTFDKLCMVEIDQILKDTSLFEKELKYTAIDIKRAALKRRVNDLSAKIRQKEDEGDEKEAQNCNEELRQLLVAMQTLDKSG
jgi:DNA primase